MDEKYIEMGEAAQVAITEERRAAASRAAMPDKDLEPDQYRTLECDDCEVPLPEFRMKKGFRCCTDCQTLRERKNKMRLA